MKFRLYHIILCLATASCTFPFGGFETPDVVPATNLPVLANAGADREVLRGFTTRLEGSGTHSPGGRAFSVSWQQITGEEVHLSNPSDLSPTFLSPLAEQSLTFRLVADDGIWTTGDDVTLVVRRQPMASAPRISAGPDRYLTAGEPEPQPEDISSTLGAEVSAMWERVEVQDSPLRSLVDSDREIEPEIYRLSATRDGLSSAPDYLLLYPADDAHLGDKAPTAALEAAEIIAPGEMLLLDATLSTDSNGDPIRMRWEQTHGSPLLPTTVDAVWIGITAPRRPQELVFRAFASDGALESAPAEVSIVVNAQGQAPVVAPQTDSRTHPNNVFVLDADGIPTPVDDDQVSFFWEQTYGEVVEIELDPTGRFATFVAPGEPGALAFSVMAELPDWLAPVQSTPEVAMVEVVELADNLPPTVYVCHTLATVDSELHYVITAMVADPEADALASHDWSISSDPERGVELIVRDEADLIDTALCGWQRHGSYPDWTSLATLYQATFATPAQPTKVAIHLTVCDDLDACETGGTALEIQ